MAVNGGITESHAHKSHDDYQNEEVILLLVQFPLLFFWREAYSSERNLCSSMKTVVCSHFSAHHLDSNQQTKILELSVYVRNPWDRFFKEKYF